MLINNISFQSYRLENITVKAENKSDNKKQYIGRHCRLLMEKHDSTDNDYHELIMCLKRHQLALEFVLHAHFCCP